jgi:hypothetical protein
MEGPQALAARRVAAQEKVAMSPKQERRATEGPQALAARRVAAQDVQP